MPLRSTAVVLATVLAALASGACAPAATVGASDPSAAPVSENTVMVQVSNTITPPTPLTVYIVPQTGGARRLLGTVSPNRSETFRYAMTLSSGSFILMGRPTGGDERRSTLINLRGGETVIWDVQLNSIRVRNES